MSQKRRSLSTYAQKQPTNEQGEKVCFECRGPIPKPRRTFCSGACVNRWKIRTDPGWVRQKVFDRDHGICALCGLDSFAANPLHRNGTPRKRRARGSGDLWQADHIVPVTEGGGECDLSNFRTLCTACHRKVTNELHGRLSDARKAEKIQNAQQILSRPLRFGDSSPKQAAEIVRKLS